MSSGRAVFLDLPADRYFCLPSAVDMDFQDWLSGKPVAQPAVEKLVALGVIELGEGDDSALAPPRLPQPTRDLSGAATTNPFWIFWAVCEQLAARLRLRRRPFAAVIATLESQSAAARCPDLQPARHRRVAAAFAGARLLMHAHNNCLSQSLAYHRACQRLGLDAVFVIGVRLDPFSAHCWVQSGDLVLNDSVERVQHFTPIMAA